MEKKLNRGGAPRKEEALRKARIVRTLFSQEEFDRLLTRKGSVEVTTLSEFIRSVCLDKPLRLKPQLSTHQENVLSVLMEIRADMLRIGVNVNQSTKRINTSTDYDKLQLEVEQIKENISQLSAQLSAVMASIETPESGILQSKSLEYGS